MRRTIIGLVLGYLLALSVVDARKIGPQPCPGGTFIVQGAPLTIGGDRSPVDRLQIGQGRLVLAACSGGVTLKGTKKGTRLTAKLSGCAGLVGKLTVTGLIAPSCQNVDVTAKARKQRTIKFKATLSRCGDGTLDAAAGEQCEPPGSAACDPTCRLIPTGTTTPLAPNGTTTTTLGPSADTLEVTPVGSPVGALVVGGVDAAGGTVVDSTTGVSVKALANTFAGSTQVALQPTTNPLDRGLGNGVQVSTSGAATRPLIVRVPYGPEVVDPNALRLAVRLSDGSWQDLLPRAVDTATHTIAAALRPPSSTARSSVASHRAARDTITFPPVNVWEVVQYLGFEMRPGRATVRVGRQQRLVPYSRETRQVCHQEEEVCSGDEDCLPPLPLCERRVTVRVPFTNDKPGFIRTWYVNDVLQGNPTIGTAIPSGAAGATYTAPASPPNPNTVTVEFISVDQQTGRMASVTAAITIVGGYHVTGDFVGRFPLCAGCDKDGDIRDHFELDLDYPDGEGALILHGEPVNAPSSVTNLAGDPECMYGGGVDFFRTTRVSVLGLGESPTYWDVEVDGTTTSGTCVKKGETGPVFTIPVNVAVDFSDDGFTNGPQIFNVAGPFGTWRFTVEERK